MGQIFISYAKEDREQARRLARQLLRQGYEVWWDRSILAGASFRVAIRDAIDQARCVVVLWSKTSVESDWVIDEANEGIERDILVPILIEQVDPPLGFGQIQTEDLTDWNGHPNHRPFERLLNSIHAKLDPDALLPPISFETSLDGEQAPAETSAPGSDTQPLGPTAAAAQPPEVKPTVSGWRWLVATKAGLTVLLIGVFLANWLETSIETRLSRSHGLGSTWRSYNARAVHWFEGRLSFEFHDLTGDLAARGYSISYFFIFPLILLAVAWLLARQERISPFRVFCMAIVIVYVLSLPFFLLFPVPERWADPDSGAVLLSDKWSTRLIEGIRPISGLDNCFPSSHTSLTVIAVLAGFLFRIPFRLSLLILGITVVLSTFVLGIHWLADITAGLGVGVLGVCLAYRLDRTLASV